MAWAHEVTDSRQPVIDGVFFLGNDPYQEWLLALLRSFRVHNPTLRAALIPFDDNIERTTTIAATFGVDLFSPPELKHLDALGQGLTHRHPGTFRKFAAFDGPFDRFMFLDADVLVLEDLSPVLTAVNDGERAVSFAHRSSPDSVYLEGELRDEALRAHRVMVNTGMWTSTRGALTVAELQATAVTARRLEGQFAPTFEQPFFNFALRDLDLPARCFTDGPFPFACVHAGATQRGSSVSVAGDRSQLYMADGMKAGLVHWAGRNPSPAMAYRNLWREYRWASEPRRLARLRRTDPLAAPVAAVFERSRPTLAMAKARLLAR